MTEAGQGRDSIRDRWNVGEPTFGGWCSIGSSFSAELIGRSGFDWACIDLQHGVVGPNDLVPMVQALSLTGTPPFARVPWNEPSVIMRVLDMGCQGVIVPLVESPADAERAVAAARYAPLGSRSWGPIRPVNEFPDYTSTMGNRRTIVVLQIETLAAVEALDDILAVDGIDAVFVGPNDLSLSAGWAPSLSADGEARPMIERILTVAHAHSVVAGIYCGSIEAALAWHATGFDMLAVTSDALLIRTGAKAALARLHASP